MKICSKCFYNRPIDQFGNERRNKDGKRTYCKSCERLNRLKEQERIKQNQSIPDFKKCTNCKEVLPKENFNLNGGRITGLDDSCKKCRYPKIIAKRFNISVDEYKKLRDNANNRCEICGNEDIKLAVDHCHSTGKIRGMLCGNCNNGLGRFKDNIEYLEKAIAYLKGDSNGK